MRVHPPVCTLLLLLLVSVLPAWAWQPHNIAVLTCDASNPHQTWNVTNLPAATNTTITLRTGAGHDPDTDCLDCNGCGAGALPHTWGCSVTSPNDNQVWNNVSGLLKSTTSGTCLAALTQFSDSPVYMAACNATDPLQRWVYDATTGLVRNGASTGSVCLDGGTQVNNSCAAPPFSTYKYCNTSVGAVERAADLVSRLTLQEKVLNLGSSNPGIARLGAPSIQFSEALHGVVCNCGAAVDGSTGFPHAMLMASSFNASLWRTVGDAVGTEVRAFHNQDITGIIVWAPDINLARDPRWGRGQETPGEDPLLTSEYVMHYSRGLQEGPDLKYRRVVSTAKHFFAYDQEGNGGVDRGSFNAIVSDADMTSYYLPAWRAAVEGAHVGSIMCSYNAVNGMPSCGNDLSMNVFARQDWQFDGFFVSDCGAIGDPAFTQYITSHFNGSASQQVRVAMEGGCDMNCGQFLTGHAYDAVTSGVMPESVIDQSLTRLWTQAINLGMLDSGVSYNSITPAAVDTPAHRQLALEAAQQGIVLLKNDNNMLPLKAGTKVAVLGPHYNATQDMLSIYVGQNTLVHSHSPLQALTARGGVVASAPGCDLSSNDTSGFPDAVAAANQADVALVFVGLHPGQGGGTAREDEGWDRHDIQLPGVQSQLIQTLVATDVPVVVVLIHGGPLAIEYTKAHAAAIVDAHYPGELGGDAIASVLWGDVSPAGRLTTTVYPASFTAARNISDMSLTNNGGITYLYYTGQPLWEFGFGMSYTTFSFTPVTDPMVRLRTDTVAARDAAYLAAGVTGLSAALPVGSVPDYVVNVTNTGSVTSDVVVLGFVSSNHTGAPLKELFGFQRVAALAPGASQVVYFSMPPSVLATPSPTDGRMRVLPGRYAVTIGDEPHAVHGVVDVVGLSVAL